MDERLLSYQLSLAVMVSKLYSLTVQGAVKSLCGLTFGHLRNGSFSHLCFGPWGPTIDQHF